MKQKELADKYGVTPQKIGQIRKKVCSDEDYCTKTKELSNFGVSKIENYFKEKDDKILEPQFVRVQIIAPTPNPLFYYCKRLDPPSRKVIVAIPSTHTNAMRPQLVFKAQVIEKSDEQFYRHEIIYQREFNRQKEIKEASY